MKILLIMDPYIPVPPPLYGGHERLVAMFLKEYTRMGHDVTLLAGPNSRAEKLQVFGKNNADLSVSKIQRAIELIEAWRYLYNNHHNFDLVHNFGRLLYLLPILNKRVRKIMSYGRDVSGLAISMINSLPNKNLIFTACSNYCVSTGNTRGVWKTVYNAIDFSGYTLTTNVEPDAPLMFLGRVEKLKGTHTAIKVALATNSRLWIAGNIANEHREFFREEIEPYLDEQIVYLGALNDEQKNAYLGKSRALLFPIEWNEPFGMVMVEAMACGTPVIANRLGSVEEVVDENITGFKVNTVDEMIDALKRVTRLSRTACAEHAKKRFDVSVIAKQYLSLH